MKCIVILFVMVLATFSAPTVQAQQLEFRAVSQVGVPVRHTPRDTWDPAGFVAAVSIEGALTDRVWLSVEPAAWLWAIACEDSSSCDFVDLSLGGGVVWRPSTWVTARTGVAKIFAGSKAWMPFAGVEFEARPHSAVSLLAGIRYQPIFQETEFDNQRFDITRTDLVMPGIGLRTGGRRRR